MHGIFGKVALLEISKNSHLTGVAGLQYTVCKDSFGVEHVFKEIEKFIKHKNIKTNIFIKQISSKMQAQNSIICECFCIGLINFMFGGKTVINFTSLLSVYDY